MKFCLYANVVSPHQLPLARELSARLGRDEFRYVYVDEDDKDHALIGFGSGKAERESWILKSSQPEAKSWLEGADVLLCGLREFDLFERRAARGGKNFYMSETWFKPPIGYFRLFHPQYLTYVRRLVSMAMSGALTMLPIGVHARRTFARVGVPERAMITWGYFVAPSSATDSALADQDSCSSTIRVLWAGRMLSWKCVDTIIRAVASANECYVNEDGMQIPFSLTVVGNGPEKDRLMKLADRLDARSKSGGVRRESLVTFMPSVPIAEIRSLMRSHDVYVLSSNAYEGWGAVVSEALEERMIVLGSNQAGASATILPKWQRFESDDARRLTQLLTEVRSDRNRDPNGNLWMKSIDEWSAAHAAVKLLNIAY